MAEQTDMDRWNRVAQELERSLKRDFPDGEIHVDREMDGEGYARGRGDQYIPGRGDLLTAKVYPTDGKSFKFCLAREDVIDTDRFPHSLAYVKISDFTQFSRWTGEDDCFQFAPQRGHSPGPPWSWKRGRLSR